MSLSDQYNSQLDAYLIINVKWYPKKLLGYQKMIVQNELKD